MNVSGGIAPPNTGDAGLDRGVRPARKGCVSPSGRRMRIVSGGCGDGSE